MRDPEHPKPASDPEGDGGSQVIVTVADEALPRLASLAKSLQTAGLAVEHVLEITGQVTGRCSSAHVEVLRRVPGVVDVTVSRRVQLPPPGSIDQ